MKLTKLKNSTYFDDVMECIGLRTIKVDRKNIRGSNRLIEDLGMDSLSIVELIVELESRCGVEFDEEDIVGESFTTVGQVIEMVERLKAA